MEQPAATPRTGAAQPCHGDAARVRFSGAARGGGRRFEPGDCVYIPPYWGHGVYSVEPSVSLASFSNSWEQARWATISSAI